MPRLKVDAMKVRMHHEMVSGECLKTRLVRTSRSSIPSLPDDASSQDSADSGSQVDGRSAAAEGRVDQEPDVVMVIPLDTNICEEPPGSLVLQLFMSLKKSKNYFPEILASKDLSKAFVGSLAYCDLSLCHNF